MGDYEIQKASTGNISLYDGEHQEIMDLLTKQSFMYSGFGSSEYQYENILASYDRFNRNVMLPVTDTPGLTFITRPRLNLSMPSLRRDNVMAMLDTIDTTSINFAVRMMLDTYLADSGVFKPLADQCPFIDNNSPFLIPLSNTLMSQTGWPDPTLDTETIAEGFFCEDFTFVRGSDMLNRTYDLNLTFRDIQGSFISALLYYWLHYVELLPTGLTVAYQDDIFLRRMNYTCSIYRFILDPSRQYITKWAKATGCMFKSHPIGQSFNHSEKQAFLHENINLSVNFFCNKIEYMNPMIFQDFNRVTMKFSGDKTISDIQSYTKVPVSSNYNYIGFPYVDTYGLFNSKKVGMNEMVFLTDKSLDNPYKSKIESMFEDITVNSTLPSKSVEAMKETMGV